MVEKNQVVIKLKSTTKNLAKSEKALNTSKAAMKKLESKKNALALLLKKEQDRLRKWRDSDLVLVRKRVDKLHRRNVRKCVNPLDKF